MGCQNIKHILRFYRKLEIHIRFGYSFYYIDKEYQKINGSIKPLIWNEFFQLNEKDSKAKAKYELSYLEKISKEELKKVFEEYWFYVYYQAFADSGSPVFNTIDPKILEYLDLPYDADYTIIKKRFRELCKKYHPDEGGDSDKFIELLEIMKEIK